ncbi:RING finger domain-containing protein [Coccidioides immitis RS]|uniref:RING finger domain-containing protein n=4 Tax=Coccidioides immitis TaxID=5501 RepID=J3KFK0_COCIM|nr:RING finger domain-containing protein [Coccidioides immitis RS]EAS34411.3 RING finger domain-containing protein [Coccidioides immitis RS]KMP05551.1 hypothetical protein CIRG_05232 [Coccidioides immitis RMSCC 2394]KMU77860.1 hypothetical protein CISG_06703 [Coccidioides immitis RMSCC 3703]TPX21859.1 hypothetical protein DIZ76_015824 [Coccidioides immitis]
MDLRQRHNAPSWHWPDQSASPPEAPGSSEPQSNAGDRTEPDNGSTPGTSYPSRMCRICLETVHPSYRPVSENLPSFLQSGPRVTYEPDDPSLGRLIRPCKCKGSSRYVHEGCLRKWRNADPNYGARNFWHCPTCGFRYRLQRVTLGRWISSFPMQIFLTLFILFFVMFILGFVADPIMNLYFDPFDTITSGTFWDEESESITLSARTKATWSEHFFKGLASLGLLSFMKVFLFRPWQWWNFRHSTVLGGRRAGPTGRDRAASISWVVIVIGVATFLYGVYKGVLAWSCRVLETLGQHVMDVPSDDDEDEDADILPDLRKDSSTNDD